MDPDEAKFVRRTAPRSRELAQFVPYLLNFVGGRWVKRFAPHAKQLGLNYSSWRVLVTLWYCGAMHLVEIADKANFDLSTLFRIVEDLEARRLLQRTNRKRRGRTYAVELTPAGVKVVRHLLPLAREHELKLLSPLSDGERLLLIELLDRLAQAVASKNQVALEPISRSRRSGDANRAPARHFRLQVEDPLQGKDNSSRQRAAIARKRETSGRRVR